MELPEYLKRLKARHPEKEIPDFEERNGRANEATVLILLQSPGPGATKSRKGSGKVSQFNEDETAIELRKQLDAISYEPKVLVLWNTVPWVLEEKIKPIHVHEAWPEIHILVENLQRLKSVVLMGEWSQINFKRLSAYRTPLNLFGCNHPSRLGMLKEGRRIENISALRNAFAAASP